MKRQRLTQRELSKMVGHDPAVVSKALKHGHFPRVQIKLKEALGVR